MPDKTSEKSLGHTHSLKRKVHCIMPETTHHAADFVSCKCRKVDMSENKFNTCDVLIKTCARLLEHSYSTPLFPPCQCEKAAEKYERTENEDTMRHDG